MTPEESVAQQMKAAINILKGKKLEKKTKEKYKGIWEMSDYQLNSPIIKAKRASMSQSTHNS